MQKIDLLNEYVNNLGLTPQQVVNTWIKDGLIGKELTKAETISLLPSKKFVTPNKVYAGMFCYSTEDNLIFPEIIPELKEQISSVVCKVKKSKIFSLCRELRELQWSSDYLYVGMEENLSGIENTRFILDAVKKQSAKAEAAQYCFNYCRNGVKKGSAFLFSVTELDYAFQNRKIVNKSFSELDEELLQYMFWSSSEYNGRNLAYGEYFPKGCIDFFDKTNKCYVRAGLVFKI